MSEVEFVDGLMVKKPHLNAPDFVKAKISIKRKELIAWLQGKSDEWINIDIKESQKGSWYAQVDTWQPDGGQGAPNGQAPTAPARDADIPLPEESPVIDEDDFDIGKVPF